MPRNMAGIAMITIDASIVAIVMLSVVLDRAIHLYRSDRGSPDVPFTCSKSTLRRTLTQSTARHLLNGNYLSRRLSAVRLLVLAGLRGGGRALEDVVHAHQAHQRERGVCAE